MGTFKPAKLVPFYAGADSPRAYQDEVVLPDFEHVRIDPLRPEAVRTFLRRWCQALFPESPKKGEEHRVELLKALERPDIRLMVTNPVMLTALAVVHWNERILPEQRADLYASIIKWLARSRDREGRPERPKADRAVALLEELALAMQLHPEGRQTQVDKRWAAESIAGEWPEEGAKRRIGAAQGFLEEEELDIGIVIGRGNQSRFWHLTFQEYLAARAIAGRTESDQQDILFQDQRLYLSEWREVVLLFAGTLHQLGRRRVDGFVGAVIDQLGEKARLADRARCVGLLGQILRDLEPLDYRIADGRYQELLDSVMAIFDKAGSRTVKVEERREAAEALGQAGDPRLHAIRENRYVTIPAGSFFMGAQSEHPDGTNYDAKAYEDEAPVHEVTLDSFEIGRYPVTVQEYQEFINAKGYEESEFWNQGGFGEYESPEDWDDQLAFPNRPVVGVKWYEAAAYARGPEHAFQPKPSGSTQPAAVKHVSTPGELSRQILNGSTSMNPESTDQPPWASILWTPLPRESVTWPVTSWSGWQTGTVPTKPVNPRIPGTHETQRRPRDSRRRLRRSCRRGSGCLPRRVGARVRGLGPGLPRRPRPRPPVVRVEILDHRECSGCRQRRQDGRLFPPKLAAVLPQVALWQPLGANPRQGEVGNLKGRRQSSKQQQAGG